MSVTSLTGDCRQVLRDLPDESVHCVVTSPPYWGLRDYGIAGQFGLEADFRDYIADIVAVFHEVRRVLRADGTVWIVLGDSYANTPGGKEPGLYVDKRNAAATWQARVSELPASLKPKDLVGIPWRVAFALQANGWYLRQDIIWAKPNPMPESVTDRCTKAHEYIFLLTKSPRYFYDADAIAEPANFPEGPWGGRNPRPGIDINGGGQASRDAFGRGLQMRNKRSVWEIATAPFSEAHFATFPPALIEPCIKAGTSERGCCAKCGAPRRREIERTQFEADAEVSSNRKPLHADTYSRHKISIPGGQSLVSGSNSTIGWSPSCACNAETVPCTVLDPFAGAGTTGLVADRLQRNAILIELNPQYAEMAQRRITDDAPLFVEMHAS